MTVLGESWKILLMLCLIATIGTAIREKNISEVHHEAAEHRQSHIAKAVQTEDGDIFDCVEIKSQPAFDHPLLKNHSIQMEPSSYPIGFDRGTMQTDANSQSFITTVSCPSGTIPIWRSGEDYPVINFTELFKKLHKGNTTTQSSQQDTGALAGLSTGEDIYGTRVQISTNDPITYGVKDKSGGITTILNGIAHDKDSTNAIGAGWFVWQDIKGDKAARFHIFMDIGRKTCYDFQCPGFVQTNPSIPIGGRINPISKYGGPQFDITLFIYQDKNSNWWLMFDRTNIVVGYWPSTLFTFLKDKGRVAFWGGLVDGPTIKIKPPPMGTGHYASEGWKKAAYVRNIQVVRGDHKLVTPSLNEIGETVDNAKCYSVAYKEIRDGGARAYWGGPGDCRL